MKAMESSHSGGRLMSGAGSGWKAEEAEVLVEGDIGAGAENLSKPSHQRRL